MTLDELLALLPDNDSGEISAADLRTIVTELHTVANTGWNSYAYKWSTTTNLGSGQVNCDWAVGQTTLHIHKTSSNEILFPDLEISRIRLHTTASSLKMNVIGPTVDQGSSYDIPADVTELSGAVPANNATITVVVAVTL